MREQIKSSNNCGKLVLLIGALMAVPLAVLPFYPSEVKYAFCFLIPSAGSFIFGIMLCFFLKNEEEEGLQWQYTMRTGSLTVVFAWMFAFLVGGTPFLLSGQLTYVQCVFEAVSGWTTTGLSVVDVTKTPHIFLFHRGFMQFCGGLGFVMMMVMFIQGKQSVNLYNAEGHTDRLMPNLVKSARAIFFMYTSFLAMGSGAYMIYGMNPLDSVVHAMCALSTGGFSNQADSIGAYNSFPIEIITIILMIIGTTNFAVLLLFVRRKFRQAWRVSEMRFLALLLAISVPLTAVTLFAKLYMNIGESFRQSLFNVVSALSTSGFSTMSYQEWPVVSVGIMIVLMLIGGGIGSTAGGIKLTRVYLMFRFAGDIVKKRVSPSRRVRVLYYYRAQGKAPINQNLILDTTGYVFCYFLIFVTGSLLLTLTADCSLMEAMFEFSSSLGTVGLSIGLTGPSTGAATLLVEIAGMVLGRLEIFIVMIACYSGITAVRQRLSERRKI